MGMNIVELMTECGERLGQTLDPPWVVWAWMEIETGTFIGEVKLVMHVFLIVKAPGAFLLICTLHIGYYTSKYFGIY